MTSSFSGAKARFGIRFSIVARRWRREIEAAVARAGLTDATWSPLVHLDETGGGISQKQLAALVGVDASTLVRLLDILETKGLVIRRVDPADARARLVDLTSEGERQVGLIRAQLQQTESALLEGMDEAEVAAALSLIDRLDEKLVAAHALRAGGDQ